MTRQRRRLTAYGVSLPYARVPEARLAVSTGARVFQRRVQLATLLPPAKRRREPTLFTLASSTWTHTDETRAPQPLVLRLPEHRDGPLMLLLDEGDNQPLPIDRVTLLLPSYAIRLFRPEGAELRLMYGRDDLGAPRYDLALLAPQMLGRVAREVHAGPEEPTAAATASAASIVSPPAFWASLALAVLVLLGMTVRLVRNAGEPATS